MLNNKLVKRLWNGKQQNKCNKDIWLFNEWFKNVFRSQWTLIRVFEFFFLKTLSQKQ